MAPQRKDRGARIEGRTLILGNDFLGLPEDALRIDLNTVKRIAVVGAGKAGAGIVADSDPELEYQETLNKARGMLKAIELAEQWKKR